MERHPREKFEGAARELREADRDNYIKSAPQPPGSSKERSKTEEILYDIKEVLDELGFGEVSRRWNRMIAAQKRIDVLMESAHAEALQLAQQYTQLNKNFLDAGTRLKEFEHDQLGMSNTETEVSERKL